MAKLSVDGLDELILSLQQVADIPDDVADEMLTAQAEVVAAEIRSEAEKLGMGYDKKNNNFRDTSETNTLPGQTRSYATGELARSVKVGKKRKIAGGWEKFIIFSGSRKRGKQSVKNTEIAFLNEYGTRSINARNFVWTAIERAKEKGEEALLVHYDKFLQRAMSLSQKKLPTSRNIKFKK